MMFNGLEQLKTDQISKATYLKTSLLIPSQRYDSPEASEVSTKKSKPKLLVVFDTNILYTKVANELVRNEIRSTISNNSTHTDISISWLIPEPVINERKFQMQKRAFELLPSLEKIEALIGHKLNITAEILVSRIEESIKRQMSDLGLEILPIDEKSVDWKNIIHRSAYRLPPFEDGEKEKGFRDALIAECLFQLISSSPSTASICRIAIVTGDKALVEFISEKTKDSKNIRILPDVGSLENLINTLVSEVNEDYVNEISDKAKKLFFEKDNKETIYYKEEIRSKMKDLYPEPLNEKPYEGVTRENGTWWIGDPIFIRKERQKITWVTPIAVDCTLYKYEYAAAETTLGSQQSLGLTEAARKGLGAALQLGTLLGSTPKKVEVGTGKAHFEIEWSVTVNQNKKLLSPTLGKITYIESTWSES